LTKILQLVGKFTSLSLNDAFSSAWIINWNFRTIVHNLNLIKPAEHHNKAVILLWSVDTDIKLSASMSLSTDTAQNVAELFLNL
jgi:hypothetical protein